MNDQLKIIGGSQDGETVPMRGADGRPLVYVYRSSTKEVWLRDGDALRYIPGASLEEWGIAFERPEDIPDGWPERYVE